MLPAATAATAADGGDGGDVHFYSACVRSKSCSGSLYTRTKWIQKAQKFNPRQEKKTKPTILANYNLPTNKYTIREQNKPNPDSVYKMPINLDKSLMLISLHAVYSYALLKKKSRIL